MTTTNEWGSMIYSSERGADVACLVDWLRASGPLADVAAIDVAEASTLALEMLASSEGRQWLAVNCDDVSCRTCAEDHPEDCATVLRVSDPEILAFVIRDAILYAREACE